MKINQWRGLTRLPAVLVAIGIGICVFWGPAGADERKLSITLAGGAEYNDNIFFSADEEDKIDDYMARLSGWLRFLNRTERSELGLSARLEQLSYEEQDDLDALDQLYSANAGYWLTPHLKGAIDAGYSRDSQPDRDLEVTGLLLGTSRRETRRFGTSAEYTLTDIDTAGLSWRYQQEDFEESGPDDYDSHQAGLWYTRRLDRYFLNTTGRANLNFVRHDFENVDTDSYSATLGVLWQFSELWNLLADAGARYTESEFAVAGGLLPDVKDETWGGVVSLNVNYQGEYNNLGLTVGQDIGAASGRNGAVERTSAVLTAGWRFAEKSSLSLWAGYYINKADAGELTLVDTDQKTFTIKPSLRYMLSDAWALEALYGYSRIEDDITGDTRDRNMVVLRLLFDYAVLE